MDIEGKFTMVEIYIEQIWLDVICENNSIEYKEIIKTR